MTTPSGIHLITLNNGKRKDLVENVEASSREARQAFLDCWFSDEARKRREALLSR